MLIVICSNCRSVSVSSVSTLQFCLFLSYCHVLLNRDIVQAVHRIPEVTCFCQTTGFYRRPGKIKSHSWEGGVEIHRHTAQSHTDRQTGPRCLSVTFNPLFRERRRRSGSAMCDTTRRHCRPSSFRTGGFQVEVWVSVLPAGGFSLLPASLWIQTRRHVLLVELHPGEWVSFQ